MRNLEVIREFIERRVEKSDDDAFSLLDIEDVRLKYKNWIKNLPRVRPFYAMKCNNLECIIKVLIEEGAGFDCASKREIEKILSFGVEPERIIYANTAKQISHLKFAAEKGVKKVTFDSESELYKIKKYHPNAEVVMRIRFDNAKAIICLGLKYGCDPVIEAPKLIEICKELDLNLIGVSFHIGSGNEDYESVMDAIKAVRDVFEVAKGSGFDLKLVDIGGGLSGYDHSLIEIYANSVNQAIEKYFPDSSVKIISEPGRYFVESAQTRVIQIISKRRSLDGKMNYFVNDGIFMSFLLDSVYGGKRYLRFDKIEIIRKSKPEKEPEVQLSTIWGSTCCSKDVILDNEMLPELEVEDWIVFFNMGCYTNVLKTDFNGFHVKPEDTIIL